MNTSPVPSRWVALFCILLTASAPVQAQFVSNGPPVILANGSTAGYYNDALGTILDGSGPQFPWPFGIGDDPVIYPAAEPDLAAANGLLGNWLAPHATLNSSWRWLSAIPADWALNTETAIIYEVDGGTQGFTNVFGDFDSDNGIYVWVNGQYRFGARSPGLPSPIGQFEYTNIFLGNLIPGPNRIQILREDSGITSGSQIRIVGSPNATAAPACVSAPSGLVSWWRGEGNAADALGANNGDLLNGVTNTFGAVELAFLLDGTDDHIRIPDHPSLRATNALTVEAWIYPTRLLGNQCVLSKWDAVVGPDQRSYSVALEPDGRVYLAVSPTGTEFGATAVFSSNSLPVNQWTYLAATYDGTALRMYINGELQGQLPYFEGIFPGTADLGIGLNVGGTPLGDVSSPFASPFAGSIDEVGIYNRALSSNEIEAIFAAGSAGKCTSSITNPPPVTCVNPASGLVSWWRAENDALDAINGHNGTLQNGATFTSGAVGQGFGFNGTDSYVNIPSSEALKPMGPFTFETWIRYSGNPGAVSSYCIAAKGADAEAPMDWALTVSANSRLRPHVNVNGSWHYFDCDTPLSAGTWYHVAMIYDGAQLQGYINGALDGSANVTGSVQTSDAPLRLGAYAPVNGTGSKAFFTGSIDEVAFYNRNLSAGELFAIFNTGSAGKCPPTNSPFNPADGLIAHYPFSGNAADVSGNGNHGTPSNVVLAADRFGSPNEAFSFNGQNAAVTVTDNPALRSLTSNYTFNAWVRFGSNPEIDAAILMKSAGAGDQRKWTFWQHVQAPPYGIGLLLNRPPGGQFQWNNNYPFTTNQWFMVTFSASAAQTLIAVDGQVVSAQSGNLVLPDTTGLAMSIGGAEPGGNQWFNGSLDDIRIYNRTFNSNDIARLYQLELEQTPPGVAAIPAITSFNPKVATVGSSVIISGTNFSPVASNNIVYFGAVRANVAAAISSSLTVTVPVGATYAPITVTVGGLTAAARTAFTPTFVGDGLITDTNFAPRFNLATGDGPTQTVIADFDGDGKPDLAVTDDYGHTLSIYRNMSQVGTLDASSFAPRVVLPANPANYSPYMLVAGDVDGDGRLDLVATDVEGNTVSIFRNQATPGLLDPNSFAPYVTFAVGTGPRAVALADLDRDGRPEIITANYDSSTVSILHNTSGPGSITAASFAAAITISTGSGTHGIAVADLDGDGWLDIATANNLAASLSLFRNLGSGTLSAGSFAPPVTLNAPVNAHFLRAADLDDDGRPELLLTSYLGNSLTIYRNQADAGVLTSNSFVVGIEFALGGRGHTTALGDLNGDGKPDIVVDTEIADTIALFQNLSTPGNFTNGSLGARVDLAAGWNAWGASVGDLDGDTRPDIIFGNTYDDTLSFYHNIVPFGDPTNPPPVVCVPPAIGLMGWWRGDGNTLDNFGTNTGILLGGTTYGAGKVGQAFALDGVDDSVRIPVSGPFTLPDVGIGQGLTVEAWIYPQRLTIGPIFEWNNGVGGEGAHFWHSVDSVIAGDGPGNLYGNLVDTSGVSHRITSPAGLLQTNQFNHVALTYDKASGVAVIYCNGVPVKLEDLGTFTPQTSFDLYFGQRPAGFFSENFFQGRIDEPSIYNRALSSNEIAGVFLAGSAGKCVSSNPPVTCVPARSGLVGWWPAQGGWHDVVSGNHAIPEFGADLTNGKVGESFNFDGVDQVAQIPNATALNPTNALTLEAWIRVQAHSDSGGVVLFGKDGAHSDRQYLVGLGDLSRSGETNVPNTWVVRAHLSVPGEFKLFNGRTIIVPGRWYHVAMTYNGATLSLYVDGILDRSEPLTGPIITTEQPLIIGGSVPGPWNFNGQIDELSLYNHALGADEIAAIYQASDLGKCAPTALPPQITQQPQSVTTNANAHVRFAVVATGLPPPDYQWFFNGNPLPAQTSAALVLNNVQTNHAGNYFVVATNHSGAVTSSIVTLTVLTFPPVIITPPQSVTATVGSQASFAVTATGTAPLTYKWYFQGQFLAKPNLPTLSISPVQFSNAGNYHVIVSNPYGSATSAVATLTVELPPDCAPAPAGIVAWWPGQSNLWDVIGGNDAQVYQTPPALTYTTGKVAAAFSFLAFPKSIAAPPKPELNLGVGEGFTFEGWIYRTPSGQGPIFGWGGSFPNQTNAPVGVRLQALSNGALSVNVVRTNGQVSVLNSPTGSLGSNAWHHVALSCCHSNGSVTLYVDGSAVTNMTYGPLALRTLGIFGLGYATGTSLFGAILDEPTLYNRALSQAEIQSVYEAQQTGKCPPPVVQCINPAADLVGWWRGESNTWDSAGINHGVMLPVSIPPTIAYTAGQIGGAFSLRFGNHVVISNTADLNVGLGAGLTVEAWINTSASVSPIVEWNSGTGTQGVYLAYSYTRGPGYLEANLVDVQGQSHVVLSPFLPMVFNQWRHVAVSYDQLSGSAALFVNGVQVTQTNLGSFTPRTTGNLYLGYRPPGPYPGSGSRLNGLMDEVAVYRRALSATEVRCLMRDRGNGRFPPVTECLLPASGIVSWWRGESNALDSVQSSHGQKSPPLWQLSSYTNGQVGLAFAMGARGYLRVAPATNLNVGAGPGLTVEGWVNPTAPKGSIAVFGWRDWPLAPIGVTLEYNVNEAGNLRANLMNTNGLARYFATPPHAVKSNRWQHIALTYDRKSGWAALYLNGAPLTVTNLGSYTPRTTGEFYLGSAAVGDYFTGAMDEFAVHNRALTPFEINAISRATNGRCLQPPVILQQPASLIATIGSSNAFTVVAEGNPLLRYQWFWNNKPLAQATNATLILTNVSPNSIGNYSVRVTNWFGAVLSSNATLRINWPPIANADAFVTASNTPATFAAAKLLENDTDANGDVISVLMVSSNSAQDGIVTLDSDTVTYTPAALFGGNDTFTYMVTDGHGGTATGTVMVTVGRGGAAPLNIVTGPVVDGGDFVVRFAGIPGLTYTIEAAPALAGPWIKVSDVLCPETNQGLGIGIFEFSEPIGTHSTRFYRTIYPPY